MITLEGPRYSANDRLHWRSAKRLKVHWRDVGYGAACRQRQLGLIRQPEHVHLLVEQVPGSRRKTDPGNVAPAAKAAIDGFVMAGLLIDDDSERLTGPDYRLAAPEKLPPGTWRLRFTITEVLG